MGTWISSLTGDETAVIMGMEMYSVQLTCFVKMFVLAGIGLPLLLNWRAFTSEKEIEAVLRQREERRLLQRERGRMHSACVRRPVQKQTDENSRNDD